MKKVKTILAVSNIEKMLHTSNSDTRLFFKNFLVKKPEYFFKTKVPNPVNSKYFLLEECIKYFLNDLGIDKRFYSTLQFSNKSGISLKKVREVFTNKPNQNWFILGNSILLKDRFYKDCLNYIKNN